jgi:hypothetical protein
MSSDAPEFTVRRNSQNVDGRGGGTFKLQGCELFQVVDGRIGHQRGYRDKATWFGQPGIPLTGVQNRL